MKIVKNILIGLGVLIILLLILSLFLPSKVHVERSMTYKAKPDTIFTLINDLSKWEKWSPWHKIYPEHTQWKFSDNTVGEGAWYSWTSPNKNVGSGKLTITKSVANELVNNDMDFMENGKATSSFIFSKEGVLN